MWGKTGDGHVGLISQQDMGFPVPCKLGSSGADYTAQKTNFQSGSGHSPCLLDTDYWWVS